MPSQSARAMLRTVVPATAASLFLSFASAGIAQTSIFVTPIPNEPFSGSVVMERSTVQPDGTSTTLRSINSIARDGQGRIYNEFRPLVPISATASSQVVSVHIYDPVTRISSLLYPQQKTFRVNAVNRPPATDTPGPFASPTGNAYPQSQFAKQQDLGTRTIASTPVHGVRETQTIPADASGSGKEVQITDDYWYSSELRLNLQIVHDDPRIGSSTTTVTQLTRTNPNPLLFAVPADYQPAGQATAHPQVRSAQ